MARTLTKSQGDSGAESSDDSNDSEPTQTLIAGRDRRVTAGNRMANLLEREEDDEVALLFADQDEEEDVEFEGSDEDASDVQLDSSSDEEDQGMNGRPDDELEGEKALVQETRAQKTQKRKAQDTLTTVAGLRKKVKIDPTPTSVSSQTRPRKKSDRVSWLPEVGEGPVRASARKQTVENKEVTHARLKDHAAKRAKVVAQMRDAEREREKQKPREMTQEDRLAEAIRTETKNSKSLNRWEETERIRADDQAAKLAALKTRKLDGPVVSWWSGMATWSGTRLIRLGSKAVHHQEMLAEPKKRGRKPKTNLDPSESIREDRTPKAESTGNHDVSAPTKLEQSLPPSLALSDLAIRPCQTGALSESPAPITFATPRGPEDFFLSGIQEYASMSGEADSNKASAAPSDSSETVQVSVGPPTQTYSERRSRSPPVAEVSHSTRNLVVLSKCEHIAPPERGELTVFYNHRKTPKLSKAHHDMCAMTSLPARYRDPGTGVAYANYCAYQKLRQLEGYGHVWSSMLGCYVGTTGVVARGVPEGFVSSTIEAAKVTL